MPLSTAKRALCVGDHEEVCASLAAPPRLDGYEVTTAVGAEEALRKALAGGFDLIVLDDRGFGGAALTLCRMLRQHPAAPPVLLVSGDHFGPTRALPAGLGSLLRGRGAAVSIGVAHGPAESTDYRV